MYIKAECQKDSSLEKPKKTIQVFRNRIFNKLTKSHQSEFMKMLQSHNELLANDVVPPAEKNIESKGKTTAEDVTKAFMSISNGIAEAADAKTREYNDRIVAVKNGNPIVKGDTMESLQKSQDDWNKVKKINKLRK